MSNTIQPQVRLQYRPYTLDPDFPVFAFIGQNKPTHPLHSLNTDAASARYLHLHNCVEITCVTCESARLYIENEVHPVRRGDVIIIFPFTAHILREDGGGTACDYLYFDPGMLLTSFSPGLRTRFPHFSDRRCACMILPADQHPAVTAMVERLLQELAAQAAEYKPYVCSLLVSLMVETTRSLDAHGSPEPNATPSLLSIMPAVQHINDHYMQPISLGTLQSLCHLSGTQLRRVFHSIMGCAPLAYIQQVRIGHACEQLLSTRSSLTEIASAVGFDSISSFHRQFVRYHGMSPSQWRKEHALANSLHLPALPFRFPD